MAIENTDVVTDTNSTNSTSGTNNISSINEKIEQLRKNRGSRAQAEAESFGFKKRTPRQIERNRSSEQPRRSRTASISTDKKDSTSEKPFAAASEEEPPIPVMPWETDYPYSDEAENESSSAKKTTAFDVFWIQAIICMVICIGYVVIITFNPVICDKAVVVIREKAAYDFSFRDSVYETVGGLLTYLNQQRPVVWEQKEPRLPAQGDAGSMPPSNDADNKAAPDFDEGGEVPTDTPPDTEDTAVSSIGDGAGGTPSPAIKGEVPYNATLAPVIFTGHVGFPLKEGRYRISSSFGFRESPITGAPEFHNAADLASPEGTPVYAILEGQVEKSETDASLGNYILINHGNGFYSVYGHCSKLIAKEGDYLRAGEVIAKVGSTGASTGNHLHFGLKKDGLWFNPEYVYSQLTE